MDKFFSKLEKLDVLMIIFVVIVCLFALVVMYGWPQGVWELGWTAISAIATFFAALVALFLGFRQEKRVELVRTNKAKIIMASYAPILTKVVCTLEIIREGLYSDQVLQDGAKVALSGLWSIERISLDDLEYLSELEPELANALAKQQMALINHLDMRGVPREYSNHYIYEGFVTASINATNAPYLKIIEDDLRRVYQKMNEYSSSPHW